MLKVKKEGGGQEPPKTPPSSPSYLDGSLHSLFEKKKRNINFNVPQLKIDIKFELPMYNGELNAEILDNWIHQIEILLYDLLKITLRFSWLLSNLEGLLSYGGTEDLRRILTQKEKSSPLGMSSLQH